MSRNARASVLVLAVVVIVVGFVLASSSGDDDSSTPPTPTAADTSSSADSADAGADAGSPASDADAGTATSDAGSAGGAAAPARPQAPLIVVRGGQPVGGVKELTFDKGDEVAFRVRADADAEVHVHGYDILTNVRAGRTARIRFPADIDGRFEVELEETGVQIARLEVQP